MLRRGGGGRPPGRRGRSPPILDGGGHEHEQEEEDGDDAPMDDDDQEVLVQDLERRIRRQQERILSAFRALCGFAAAATIAMAALETWTTVAARGIARDSDDEGGVPSSSSPWRGRLAGCWLHAALSVGTHLAVSSSVLLWDETMGRSTEPGGSAVGGAAAAGVVLLLFHALFVSASRRLWDDARTGWGMGIANLLTLAVAAVLIWDRRDSDRALRELNDARYKHKTL